MMWLVARCVLILCCPHAFGSLRLEGIDRHIPVLPGVVKCDGFRLEGATWIVVAECVNVCPGESRLERCNAWKCHARKVMVIQGWIVAQANVRLGMSVCDAAGSRVLSRSIPSRLASAPKVRAGCTALYAPDSSGGA